jgi:hypothetical protein
VLEAVAADDDPCDALGLLLCVDLAVAAPPADTWRIAFAPGAGDEALARRRAWLGD